MSSEEVVMLVGLVVVVASVFGGGAYLVFLGSKIVESRKYIGHHRYDGKEPFSE